MEKISKNITYNEAVHSNTAKRKGIENIPNDICRAPAGALQISQN